MAGRIPHGSVKQNHYWGKISLKDPKKIVTSSIIIYQELHGFSGKAARTPHTEVIVYSGDENIYTFSQEFPYATWKKYTVDEILRGMEGDKPRHSILACDWLNWKDQYSVCIKYYRAMRDYYDSLIPQLPWYKRLFTGFYDVPELAGHIAWAIRRGLLGANKPLDLFDLPWGNKVCSSGAATGQFEGLEAIESGIYLFPGEHRERIYPALYFRDSHFIDLAA
jgi:hypothetical protein